MEKKDEFDHESGKNWSKLLVTPIISVLCRNPPVSDRREDGGLRLSQLIKLEQQLEQQQQFQLQHPLVSEQDSFTLEFVNVDLSELSLEDKVSTYIFAL